MNNIHTYILLILTIFIVYYFLYYFNDTVYILSDVDKNVYRIQKGKYKTPEFLQASANTLGLINTRIEILINHLVSNYKNSDNYYFIKMLRKNYKYSVLQEASIDKRYTTFTIDKKSMHICLRTRDSNEELYDINLLFYVVLHELAHLCNYSKSGYPIHGHGKEFIYIFKFLVTESIKLGLYIYEDYRINKVDYCGVLINSSIIS